MKRATKKQHNFKLSKQTQELLEKLASFTGKDKTQIVEEAILLNYKSLRAS